MLYIDTTKLVAEDTLLAMSQHLPAGIDFGTPRLITGDGSLLTSDGGSTAVLTLAADGCSVWRAVELSSGRHELVTWEYGEEVSRKIVRRSGNDGGNDGGNGGDDPEDGPEPYDGPPGGAGDPEFRELLPDRVAD